MFDSLVQESVLTVPTEAVIKTGARSIVIVADDANHFRPAVVRVGAEHGGRSEILDGLQLGQNVVSSGQFLIDSEANLLNAFDVLAGSNDSKPKGAMPMFDAGALDAVPGRGALTCWLSSSAGRSKTASSS